MFTLFGSVSNPVTLCPASAKRSSSGKPPYPHPIMATFSWAPLKNSGFRSIGMSRVVLLNYVGITAPRSRKEPNQYSRSRRAQEIRPNLGDSCMRAVQQPLRACMSFLEPPSNLNQGNILIDVNHV